MENEEVKLNRLVRLFEEANRDTVTTDELAQVVEGISKALSGHSEYIDEELESIKTLCKEVQANSMNESAYTNRQVDINSQDIVALKQGIKNVFDKLNSLPNHTEILQEVDKRLLDTLKTWDVSDIQTKTFEQIKEKLPNDKKFVEKMHSALPELTGDEIVEKISKAKKKLSAQNISDLPSPQTVVYSSSNTGSGSGGAVDSVNGQTGVVVLDTSDISATTDKNYVTDAQLTVLGNTSGTNTGDQTSIVGITGTKAEFNTAVTDGNFLYVGDITQYTDELAQDAVGGMVANSTFVDLDYSDATPSLTASLSATGTPSSSTFLRGDNTWATPAGSGDVSKVGTPLNNQVGVWTGDGTIEGDPDLTFDTSTNTLATGIVTVSDEAYGAGWNGSLQVPTKNALYDKIETLGGGSGITRTIVVTSGSATMGSSASVDYVYFVVGAHTMSLPAASGNTNRYTVKNNHSANITIDTAGAENIEGSASISIAPEEAVDIISDGTNWFVV